MKMNEGHDPASGWVQCPPPNVAAEITEPGHLTVALAIPAERGDAMLKTAPLLPQWSGSVLPCSRPLNRLAITKMTIPFGRPAV
jgi:hypothetical protein